MRDRLAEDAGYALWLVIVVREACGLNSTHMMQTYRVPNEAYACTGPSVMCRQNCRNVCNDYVDYLPGFSQTAFRQNHRTRSAPPVARRYLADRGKAELSRGVLSMLLYRVREQRPA